MASNSSALASSNWRPRDKRGRRSGGKYEFVNMQATFRQLLNAGRRVVAVDRQLLEGNRDDFVRGVQALSQQVPVDCFAADVGQINKSGLANLLDEDSFFKHLPGVQPGYRYLCDLLLNHRRGALFIHDADQLDGRAVQLLSQLLRFIRAQELDWKIVLSIDSTSENLHVLRPLDIELFYTEHGERTGEQILLDRAVANKAATGRDTSPVVIGLALLFVLGIVGWTMYSDRYAPSTSGPDPDRTTGVINRSAEVSENPTELPSEPVSELNNYLAQLAARDAEFERQLLALKQRNHNNPVSESQQAPTPATSKPVIKAYRSDKRLDPAMEARLLSSEVSALSRMINRGADFAGANQRGENALIIAVLAGRDDVLSLLLSQKLPVDHGDEHGRTALYYAAVSGNQRAASMLLRAGAGINTQTKLFKTPLMAATHNGHTGLVELLLDAGANPNQQDHSGWSALFYAVWDNRSEIVLLLRKAGANTGLRDRDGYTPAQIADLRSRTAG